MRAVLPAIVSSLILTGAAMAGGSPKAFEKFAGNYDGEGTFKNRLGTGTVNAKVKSEGSLAMASSPRSAVLSLNGTVEAPNGQKGPMSWKLTFRRKNVCIIDMVYPSGDVAQVTGRYEARKRRITFSGPMRYVMVGGFIRSGTTTGKLRLSASKITFVQQDALSVPLQTITVRQTLTKD